MLIEENPPQGEAFFYREHEKLIEYGGGNSAVPLLYRSGGAVPTPEAVFDGLTADDLLQQIDSEQPEIWLLGSGAKQRFVHPKITAQLAAAGIALECMNTAAACRTLLLLEGEGRKVWAWLWP
ncbi:MTH938/NDUFAF3 family protein [Neisseria sp. ZJ106]|uniref:MTH938/NDUFAF3 family protein n=1 Tax=Neisseria lisongii TaxID=2912188 RepID=A0ABY7RLP5_9NEIS|nr:MTH938/NDUFAF3 family protein [Neisseria lisongii]MCF7521455.1 MTH938/NDUFAF3 family protein [Neisseria lisongii]WCL72294.1 MTH938/NDUFAF3 family protein [Neisseria lisongii]